MTYEEAAEYMLNLNKRGIHPGLEGIRELVCALNNPERDLKVIHVVGTNGKGSTALFLSEMLRASGYKVGIYSSPAVFSEFEIIKVNGRPISKKEYAELVDIISKANTMGCTRFEVETAMSFMYFAKKQCDFVILEAGMGGLMDATNVVPSCVESVITAIGMDHMQYLGDTIEEIARNKTGVIKPESITVSTIQKPEAMEVVVEASKENNSELVVSDYALAKNVKYSFSGTKFSYKGMKDLFINLLGTYQIQNATLAIDAALALKNRLVNITEKDIRKGLKNATESGRFEKISDKPLFFLDGAHNEPASLSFRENIETYFTNKRIIYIMGMLRDKDVEKVVANTVDLAACVFTVATPNKARTMSAFELAAIVRNHNQMVSSLDSIEEAVEMAYLMAERDTVIIAFGSLSHLDAIKKAVLNRKKMKRDTHGVEK